MPPPTSPRRDLIQIGETLTIGAAGGIGFALMGLPAGLVSGSMLAVAAAALIGRPMKVPMPLARVCFIMIGMLLGAVVTPETLKGIATWPASVAILAVSAVCIIAATASYLRFAHGWDALSALLGASPGSMGQVMVLSAEFGADVRGIAVVQVMRVLLIVLGLPSGLALFGLTMDPVARTAQPGGNSILELAILVGACVVAALALLRLRFPGGLMFGAMMSSAILHGSGLIHATLPWWAASAGMILLGAVAGSRFANTSPRLLLSYLGAAFGSFAVAVSVAVSFALLVAALLPLRAADVAVAFAPGALDTMMVLALALHLDPVYVGAHHLARFLVVTFTVAFAARRMVRRPPDAGRRRWRRPGQGTFDD